MTMTAFTTMEDRALKEKQRAIWALGDYPTLPVTSSVTLALPWSTRPMCDPASVYWTWPQARETWPSRPPKPGPMWSPATSPRSYLRLERSRPPGSA